MAFGKKTVRDIDLKSKRVLMRVDYNVPIEDGKVASDYRINKSLPTIQYLLEQDCSIVLMSHLGRPDGKSDKKYSLEPVAKRLSELLDKEVGFAEDCVGQETTEKVQGLKPGEILVLENVRFHEEEEANDENFARA